MLPSTNTPTSTPLTQPTTPGSSSLGFFSFSRFTRLTSNRLFHSLLHASLFFIELSFTFSVLVILIMVLVVGQTGLLGCHALMHVFLKLPCLPNVVFNTLHWGKQKVRGWQHRLAWGWESWKQEMGRVLQFVRHRNSKEGGVKKRGERWETKEEKEEGASVGSIQRKNAGSEDGSTTMLQKETTSMIPHESQKEKKEAEEEEKKWGWGYWYWIKKVK
ncbi:hypothetical protein HMI54_015204 [Coelomomyces lativittatus]|nr:hypothetical protein HMI54_015204 [Coelomomyces lativittatus]KAJ1513786.1 hypothetical protein HMI56_001776 [Coelomomyces lativittatus]KAJ1515581.1 hypothetical protein HMI55_003530 [Coelomomyces lativittatus]